MQDIPTPPYHQHIALTELRLLFGTRYLLQIANSILGIELDSNLPTQARGTTIKPTRLDTSDIRHDFQLCIQRRSALSAEEVLVDFARVAFDVPGLRAAGRDFEVGPGDDNVGGIGSARPSK